MKNTDRVVEYLLKNAGKLGAEKIKAMATVIKSLGGEGVEPEPNNMKNVPNENTFSDARPIDFSEVEGFQFDDGEVQKVKVYKTPS